MQVLAQQVDLEHRHLGPPPTPEDSLVLHKINLVCSLFLHELWRSSVSPRIQNVYLISEVWSLSCSFTLDYMSVNICESVSEECIALIGNYSFPAGGLFGSNTFSQPATSSTSTGFGFGPSSGTSTSLFGNTAAGTTTSLFSNQNNAFGSTKPTTFGSKRLCRHSLNNMLLNLPWTAMERPLSTFGKNNVYFTTRLSNTNKFPFPSQALEPAPVVVGYLGQPTLLPTHLVERLPCLEALVFLPISNQEQLWSSM